MTTTHRVAGSSADGLGGVSRWVDIDGPVHYLDFGGPAGAPLIVAVHGLGGSAVNWTAIAPLLTRNYRVVAPDLAGFGLTESSGRRADVSSNRALLHRFVEEVANGPAILMGNSMGGMIVLLEAQAAPENVAGLILIDPALPFQPVRPDPLVTAVFALSTAPVLGPMLARQRRLMPVESVVASTLALCCVDPARVRPDVVALHIEVAKQRSAMSGNGKDFAHAARSVIETAGSLRGPAYRRGIRHISCPVLLVHGERDRLVPVAAARMAAKAHPDWTVVLLPDLGHIPQLEDPDVTAAVVTTWLADGGASAAKAAKPPRSAPLVRSRSRLRGRRGSTNASPNPDTPRSGSRVRRGKLAGTWRRAA